MVITEISRGFRQQGITPGQHLPEPRELRCLLVGQQLEKPVCKERRGHAGMINVDYYVSQITSERPMISSRVT